MDSVTTLVSGIPTEISWLLTAFPAVILAIIIGKGLHLWRAQNQIIAAMDQAAAPAAGHAAAK
jgi:hypothetical protein